MSAGREQQGELRPAYRTLDEPSRLLGLSLGQWGVLVVCVGLAYGWLQLSPLPWRANVSLAVVALGAPLALLVLREPGALGPERVIAAAFRWRTRPKLLAPVGAERPVTQGGVCLAEPVEAAERAAGSELPWLSRSDAALDAEAEAETRAPANRDGRPAEEVREGDGA
ncbi:MAG: hypothetical protein GEU88_15345 [Solirubrobacterales bacterium]|nr:hypothetical protein [Solirubrobacterales bacterium]